MRWCTLVIVRDVGNRGRKGKGFVAVAGDCGHLPYYIPA